MKVGRTPPGVSREEGPTEASAKVPATAREGVWGRGGRGRERDSGGRRWGWKGEEKGRRLVEVVTAPGGERRKGGTPVLRLQGQRGANQ